MNSGVVFQGKYGQVLSIHTDPSYEEHLIKSVTSVKSKQGNQTTYSGVSDASMHHVIVYGDDIYFVEEFPYPAAVGQGYEKMMAFWGGYFTYTNNSGSTITIPKLIYGKPCQKIFSPQEIKAAQKAEEAKEDAVSDKVLKYNEEMAAKGDPIGLLRMGERYRDGDGVNKDLSKAKNYLQKAANAGSPTAADELKQIENAQ